MVQSKTQSKQLCNTYFNGKEIKKNPKLNLRSSKSRHNIFEALVTKAILELIAHGSEEEDLQHLMV